MKYVFGPVPSRRLGQSLGIDPVPLKTCNWNCVYCQLGRSVPLNNKVQEYFPRQAILDEVEAALNAHKAGEIDWITFVGSGEPTLHKGIGWLIRQVKMLTDLPIAVITNGALLYLPEIRHALYPADAVLPSLDAGNGKLYRKINRPLPDLTFPRLVEGLLAFQKEFSGQLWVEIMLVRGLNDSEEALEVIAAVLRKVKPNQVHINLPTRPPAEPWVDPPDEAGIARAKAFLGDIARVVTPHIGQFNLAGASDLGEAILGVITRHPVGEDDLSRSFGGLPPDSIQNALQSLLIRGEAQVVERYGKKFWVAGNTRFAPKTPTKST